MQKHQENQDWYTSSSYKANHRNKLKLQYLGDGAHSFGASFPKHQFLVTVQVLWSLNETEMDCGLVPSP